VTEADTDDVTLELLDRADPADLRALNVLLPQVSSRARPITPERLDSILGNPSTEILVARLDGRIVGMALLLTLTTLTGASGHVEEVAVDERVRGRRIGTLLIEHLLARAAALGLDFVDLTSRSSRVAANRLYRSAGFEARETNIYRHRLEGLRP
jgi:ribosomal protein S18 acetylase RimI-like enzyme